jgi:predicted glutamine amidotransferase
MAALRPGTALAERDVLNRCWRLNPHGGGFAILIDGKITTYKSLVQETFIDKLIETRERNPNAAMIWHMRAASHGVVSEANIHPFVVTDSLVFAHNGHITRCDTAKGASQSDTNRFNEVIMKRLPNDFILHDAFSEIILSYIGHSKLLLLDANKGIIIAGESRGSWVDGTWWSNDMWKSYQQEKREYNYRVPVAQPRSIRGGKCPTCLKDVSLLDTIIVEEDNTMYAQKMCHMCCHEFRTSFKLTQTDLHGFPLVKKHTQYECVCCEKSAAMESVWVIDPEQETCKLFCSRCYVDKFIGSITRGIFEIVNNEFHDTYAECFGTESNKKEGVTDDSNTSV